jgi:hypothetical protein
MNGEAKQEILGQLREIYDGYFSKSYGTGQDIVWQGKVGMISGVTSAIHQAREMYASMGERFIMYSLVQPPRKETARRAIGNTMDISIKRDEIQTVIKEYLDDSIEIPKNFPSITPEFENDILDLAHNFLKSFRQIYHSRQVFGFSRSYMYQFSRLRD